MAGSASKLKTQHMADLMKNLKSFTDGQVEIITGDNLSSFEVVVSPNAGPFKYGKFTFWVCMGDGYPKKCPDVMTDTVMFHPNLEWDSTPCGEVTGYVCYEMFNHYWEEHYTLIDLVQGLMILMHNPNLQDSVDSSFWNFSPNEFQRKVRASLMGAEVEELPFPRNYHGPITRSA